MMGGLEDFKYGEFHGKVLGQLEALKIGQEIANGRLDGLHQSLEQFKVGIGVRVEEQGKSIVRLDAHQSVMAKVMWVIGGASFTALVTALFRIVFGVKG